MCMLPFSPRSSAYNSDNIYPIVKLKVNINVHKFHLITNIYIFVHQLTVLLQIRSCKFSNSGKVASKSIYYPACSLGNVVYESIFVHAGRYLFKLQNVKDEVIRGQCRLRPGSDFGS